MLCWLPLSLCAQVFDAGSPQLSWNDFVDEYLSMLDDESEEANVLTLRGYAALDEIEPFLDHPLNLNTATAEDFRAFAFLSAAQIDSLLSYRRRLRAFASPGELMGVRGLDYRRRRWLSLFTFVGDTLVTSQNWRKRWFSGRHSLEMRAELHYTVAKVFGRQIEGNCFASVRSSFSAPISARHCAIATPRTANCSGACRSRTTWANPSLRTATALSIMRALL